MKSKHTILKEKYMVNQPIYTDVDKIKYSKNKLFMEKSLEIMVFHIL